MMFYSTKKDIGFYYIYWNDGNPRIDWLTLVLSICTVRHIYPDSYIKVINYTKPNEELVYFSKILNFKIIYEQNPHYRLLNPEFNIINMISKPIDIFNHAKKDNVEFGIMLDADVFFTEKLEIENSDLVNLLIYPHGGCNSGIITFKTSHASTTHMFDMYNMFVSLCQSPIKDAKEKLVSLGYGFFRILSEEMVFNMILKKMTEWNSLVYQNLGEKNHFVYKEGKQTDSFNAIHTMYIEKTKICSAISKTKYIQNLINRFMIPSKYSALIAEQINKPISSSEETYLVSLIDACKNV